MSKSNLRNTINLNKDKQSIQSRLTQSTAFKSISRGSLNNSNPSSSTSSVANISINFMKESNFPKLFNQSSMLFSFNPQPQTTKNSSSLRSSIGFSGFNSGTRTPNSSSLTSLNSLFQKEHLRKNSLFHKKPNQFVIDISKNKKQQRQKLRTSFCSIKKQGKQIFTLNNISDSQTSQIPSDIAPKGQNIKVFIRIKPSDSKQIWKRPYILRMDEKHVDIEGKLMAYDYVFPVQSKQEEIFQRVGQPVLAGVFQGYNGTIFAYGQTGSGKTHTIFGGNNSQTQGIISRSVKHIFKNMKSDYKVSISLLQIYKQELYDLLKQTSNDLKIKQTSNGISVQGLSKFQLRGVQQTLKLIQNSLKNRKVACTKLNQKSSRSHTILTIFIQGMEFESKLCLIDLAGSEKANKAGVVGQNFQQMKKINYSLSCLGNVINALVTRKKNDHIPFRDSKLTRLLKDSLSGRFRTSIIVNCSSDPGTQDQTMSSLKFADRAKKVKITLTKCGGKGKQNIQYLQKVIQKLTADLESTKRQLNRYKQICIQKPEGDSERKRQQCQSVLQSYRQQKHSQSPQITARQTIPSERVHLEQQMKKYGKQNILIKATNLIKKQQRNEKQQKIRNNFPLSQLSSLNVSKSTINIYGEINSPSVSSLSYRPDQNIDDFSFHFSRVIKQEAIQDKN